MNTKLQVLLFSLLLPILVSCVSKQEIQYIKCKNNSVNSFGAKGDGNTDDTRAIQDALSSGEPVIEFEAGATYLISRNQQDALIINRSITIKGNDATIYLLDDAEGATIIKSNINSQDGELSIEDLFFDGGDKTANAIHITGQYNKVRLSNITTSNYTLKFEACASTLNITSCHLGFNGGNSSPNISVTSFPDCNIKTTVTDCIVEYRKFSKFNKYGIHFGNISQNSLVTKNRVLNLSNKFIDCYDLDGIGKNSIITENFSEGGSFNLKRIVNSDKGYDPVVFANNVCVKSKGPGFILRCPVNAYNLICEKADGISVLLLDDSKEIASPQRIIRNLQIIEPNNTAIKINTDNVIIDGFFIKGAETGVMVLPHENGQVSKDINILNGVFENVQNALITHKDITLPKTENLSYKNVSRKLIHK